MIFSFWFKDIDIPVIVWLVDAVICNDSYFDIKDLLWKNINCKLWLPRYKFKLINDIWLNAHQHLASLKVFIKIPTMMTEPQNIFS